MSRTISKGNSVTIENKHTLFLSTNIIYLFICRHLNDVQKNNIFTAVDVFFWRSWSLKLLVARLGIYPLLAGTDIVHPDLMWSFKFLSMILATLLRVKRESCL